MLKESWKKLPISLTELCINTTLRCGQSFRWRKSANDEIWSIALHGRILSVRQDPEFLHYRAIFPSSRLPTPPASSESKDDDTLELVKHYFNLSPNLTQLYDHWATNDPNFASKAPKFTGIRILQQDAWEALVGFICSSNNNISRIGQMVHALCENYGPIIGHLDGVAYHDFPLPGDMVGKDVEGKLKDLKFGYRAGYIALTARMVHERGIGWLDGLRNPERPVLGGTWKSAGPLVEGGREGYRHAHAELLSLQGVGPKVADCVSLMGLGWGEAVPVDTHVWQIAVRDYRFGKGKHASLTKANYEAIGNKFRGLWGVEAGWAQSVLFTANLKAFSERLVEKREVKEEKIVIKKEENGDVVAKVVTKTVKLETRIKRELEDDTKIFEAGSISERTKRRRHR